MSGQCKPDQKKTQPPHRGPTAQTMWEEVLQRKSRVTKSTRWPSKQLNLQTPNWHGVHCKRLTRCDMCWKENIFHECLSYQFLSWMEIGEYWKLLGEEGCPWILSDWQNWRSLSGATRVTGKRERGNDLSHTHWTHWNTLEHTETHWHNRNTLNTLDILEHFRTLEHTGTNTL